MFIDPYLATVTIFAGNFAPQGWMFCQGQLLSIAEYEAVYSLIGTTYGGDGQNNFALPDLRGRVAVHPGQGPGLSSYQLGQVGGQESLTLLSTNLPVHTHPFLNMTSTGPGASSQPGTTDMPTNNVPAQINGAPANYSTAPGTETLGASVVNTVTPPAGGSQPISTVSPYLAMNYIICVAGIFPSRN